MRRLTLVLVLLLALLATACARGRGVSPAVNTPAPGVTPAAPAGAAGAPGANPFGLLLNLDSPQGQAVARALGVNYLRPVSAIIMERWDRTCSQCEIARQMGLKLILTVRTNGGGIGNPSSPPSDLEAYRRTLGQILDRYPPEVLAVENEENSKIFYTGTPEEYGVELKAACEVAHSKGIKCTNGGLVSAEVAGLVWDWMLAHRGAEAACSFARRALEKQYSDELCQAGSVERLSARARQALEKGRALMQAYRGAGMDYMNFHWYISDPEALGEAVAFLRLATGLPVMTNEIGQQNEDPAFIRPLLQKAVDLGLPYIVWYSVDAPKARSLYNPDGSLRPAGLQFQAYIQEHYK